jgi:tetratricopeptide (TPR) repeat protein
MGDERMTKGKEAPNFCQRQDRLSPYLEQAGRRFVFDEFSAEYLKREKLEYLTGIPIPFRREDLTAFHAGTGLSVTQLADNMAFMCGVNPGLPYVPAYLKYLARFFNEKLIDVLTSAAGEHLVAQRYLEAAVYFRGALVLSSSDRKGVFGYACACREWYLSLEAEDSAELIKILKDESMEYFEWTAELFPDFSAAYYFLGYAYLNMGLYTKAQLTWKRFLELATSQEEIEEIQDRMDQLQEPVKIEAGINLLLGGKLTEGLAVLEPYVQSEFKNWWPLHYYLASAYEELSYTDEAIEGFLKVLELVPSHGESALSSGRFIRKEKRFGEIREIQAQI